MMNVMDSASIHMGLSTATIEETLRSVLLLGLGTRGHYGRKNQAVRSVHLVLLFELSSARHLNGLAAVKPVYLILQILVLKLK
jgi:hypothetical protein